MKCLWVLATTHYCKVSIDKEEHLWEVTVGFYMWLITWVRGGGFSIYIADNASQTHKHANTKRATGKGLATIAKLKDSLDRMARYNSTIKLCLKKMTKPHENNDVATWFAGNVWHTDGSAGGVKPSQYVSCSLMELHSKFDFGVSLEFNPYPSLLVAEIIK